MPAPCPAVGEGSRWDDDILGSVFSLSPMLLIMCVPTYFVKVWSTVMYTPSGLSLIRFLDGVLLLALDYPKGSWSPMCFIGQGWRPGRGGRAGVALFPFEKPRTKHKL